jgi:hypothetical protein
MHWREQESIAKFRVIVTAKLVRSFFAAPSVAYIRDC